MPLVAPPLTTSEVDAPVAGVAFTRTYKPQLRPSGASYDPADHGGTVDLVELFTTAPVGGTYTGSPMASAGPAVKTGTGQYQFSIPALSAGTYYARTTWHPDSSTAIVYDTDDTIVVYPFAGSFSTTALCSLTEVKLQLNKGGVLGTTATNDDPEIQSYIDSVTAPIEDYCGRILQAAVTEFHDVRGGTIVLREENVTSITSVTEYIGPTPYVLTQILHPSDTSAYAFRVDPSIPTILNRYSSGNKTRFLGEVEVLMVAGMVSVPTAINLAARIISQHLWETQRGARPLPTQGPSDLVSVSGFDGLIPSRAVELLNRYRRTPGIA